MKKNELVTQGKICDMEKLWKGMENYKKEFKIMNRIKTIVNYSLNLSSKSSTFRKANNYKWNSRTNTENVKNGNTCMILNLKRKQNINKIRRIWMIK